MGTPTPPPGAQPPPGPPPPGSPPPGGPPPDWAGQPQAWAAAPPRAATPVNATLWSVLAVVPLVAVTVGLFVPENGSRFWDGAEAWSVFALACAVLVLAPLARSTLGWTAEQAWLIGAAGAAGLLLYWVLLVLPEIGRNTAFALTIAAAAAVAAMWLAPGRRL